MRISKLSGRSKTGILLALASLATQVPAQTSPSKPSREQNAAASVRQARIRSQAQLRQGQGLSMSVNPTRSIFDVSPEPGTSPNSVNFAVPPNTTGTIGRSVVGQVGQRQSVEATTGLSNPLARINGRIATRIRTRVNSRFNSAGALQSSQDAIAAAADQARVTSSSPH